MDTIQIKRADKMGVSFLADGELGYSREEKALYIGDGGRRNQKLCSADTAAKVETLEGDVETLKRDKLTATAAEAIAEIAEGADLNSVIATVNLVISSLKTSGIMKGG